MDRIIMSQKELKRLRVTEKVVAGELTQIRAAEILGMSERQIRRIVHRVRDSGPAGICHKNRGCISSRRISENEMKKILTLCEMKYIGFGPTLAAEKLAERDQIQIGRETLRKWFFGNEIEYPRRRRKAHRQWRERKEHRGEMVQMDGSHHEWFEKRGPKCVLMGYIDDATGNVFARFYEYEGTMPALDGFRRYVSENGLPLSVYLDRHTTYKSPAKATIDDELNDKEPMSQFERALEELGVRVIHANSPQAKGRIERLFKTFQDRVIKEMRLEEIRTIQEGNSFFEKYLPKYNHQFGRIPKQACDLHRANPGYQNLLKSLCIRNERVVRNDSTFSYEGKKFLITDRTSAKKIYVAERLDDRIVVRNKDRNLKYREVKENALSSTVAKSKRPEPPRGIRIGGIMIDIAVSAKGGKAEKWSTPMGVVHEGQRTF